MATQSQINASLGLPPGINPDGSWNAQDYIARKVAGQPDTQAQVDAANAANPYSAQNMAKVDITRPGQYVQDEGGSYVALSPNVAGYDPTNPTALTYLGELRARGGNDTTTQQFNATATPAQKAEADRLWSIEKARLEEIDRQAALAAQGQTSADQGKTMTSATKANPSALPAGFLEGLAAIPNVTDQQIVAAMKTANVSPKNLADGLGIAEGEVAARVARTVPYGSTVQLGDTIVQPVYQVTGSGEDQQIGAIENVLTYRESDNKAGGGYTQYTPDGTFQRSGTQMKVNATKDFVKFALTAGALFGGAALAGLGSSVQAVGLTAAEAAGLGLTATEAAALGFTPTQLAAAGYTAAEITAATAATTAATTTTATTTAAATAATAATQAATIASSTGGLLTAAQVTKLLASGLTADNISKLVSGGLLTGGSLLQQQTSKEATEKAQKAIETETAAAKAAAGFKPVGMTTRFGTSEFKTDPVTGQLTSAGYTLSPEAKYAQDFFRTQANLGLQQVELAPFVYAPLKTGANMMFDIGQKALNAPSDARLGQIATDYLTQSAGSKALQTLGEKYIAKSPEDVAADYLKSQMALLQPGRELELANLQNKLQQQGRGGLSVAQGGALGATTPELQALYNARATQEAQLAANAPLYGQQQVQFGAGLFGTGQQLGMQGQQFGMDTLAKQQALDQSRIGFGAGLYGQGAQTLGNYYTGLQQSYAPYTAAFGQMQALEAAGQQPLTLAAGLAQQSAQAGTNVAKLGLTGAQLSTGLATSANATANPYAQAMMAAGSPNSLFGQVGASLLTNYLGSPSENILSSSAYGPGIEGFNRMLTDIYG